MRFLVACFISITLFICIVLSRGDFPQCQSGFTDVPSTGFPFGGYDTTVEGLIFAPGLAQRWGEPGRQEAMAGI